MDEGSERAPAEAPSQAVLGVDTDALVHWAMADAPHHQRIRRCFAGEVQRGGRLGLTLQVLQEFLHVTTDSRRFEHPLPMTEALRLSLELWTAKEVERLLPTARAHERLCELMDRLHLGRRRILEALGLHLENAQDVSPLAARHFVAEPIPVELLEDRVFG